MVSDIYSQNDHFGLAYDMIYPRVSGSRSPNDSNSNKQEWINIPRKANSPAYPWKGILHGKWYETRESKEIK